MNVNASDSAPLTGALTFRQRPVGLGLEHAVVDDASGDRLLLAVDLEGDRVARVLVEDVGADVLHVDRQLLGLVHVEAALDALDLLDGRLGREDLEGALAHFDADVARGEDDLLVLHGRVGPDRVEEERRLLGAVRADRHRGKRLRARHDRAEAAVRREAEVVVPLAGRALGHDRGDRDHGVLVERLRHVDGELRRRGGPVLGRDRG